MKSESIKRLAVLMFVPAVIVLGGGIARAQGMYSSSSGGWSTGYGTVYGSHGYAMATQDMYRMTQRMMNQNATRDANASSRSKGTSASPAQNAAPPARVVRNHGKYVPNPAIDTGKAFADALGDTAEEKVLIRKIYNAAKADFDKEAAARGWKNNIAAGLTYFTLTAVTIYHSSGEATEEGIRTYYQNVNAALDEIPEIGRLTNKDKQNFNNMNVGFAGLLLAGYAEGAQNNNADTIAAYRKLAGMLIEMVLKTDPDNIRIENGQFVMK